jgi:predicted RNA-binding protein (virulence factor B family)
MDKIKLGDYNTLKVTKEVEFGMYLDGGEEGEILLPQRYVPEGCKPGDELKVFLYLDNEERLVATTLEPKAKVGDFAYLEVAWVNEYRRIPELGSNEGHLLPFQRTEDEDGDRKFIHCTYSH